MQVASAFDFVIRGGLVVDGTGETPFIADVAITDGRIVEIGSISGAGKQEADATDRVVTPGFVDIHTHFDGQAIWSSRLNPSSGHGVTTVVMGNCGVGFAPCRKEDHDLLINVMEGVEDIPGAVMAEGLAWDWETFPQYLDALEARPRDIDTAVYLPHSPLRVYAMGQRGAAGEPATAEDLALMQSLACEAIEAGALGFASSRQVDHRTREGKAIPSFEAAEAELLAIAGGLKRAGRGIIQMIMDVPHLAWSGEIDLLTKLARASGRPVTFSLGCDNDGSDGWRVALRMVEDANRAGASLTAQVFPRPIGMVLGHTLTVNPFCLCPSYKMIAGLPFVQKLEQLRRPEVRERLLKEQPDDSTSALAKIGRRFEWMFPLAEPPDYEPPPESSIGSQATQRGVKPEELAYDLLLEQDGQSMLYVALTNFPNASLDSVYELLRHEDTIIGLGDGGAHYGVVCDASFPTSMLAYWTRDRDGERLPLAWAVRALACEPARLVGLNDRGVIAPGYKADLNIIDYNRLTLHRPQVVFDLPAGGRRLDQIADGYDLTMVSGEVICRKNALTGALPGRLIRGPQECR